MSEHTYHTNDLSSLRFLVTGGAGFIGANLVAYLVKHQAGHVRILDNLSTGSMTNIDEFIGLDNVSFINGDIRDLETCKKAMEGIDFVSHQAALGSVPRSINDPITSNDVNVGGFLNMLVAQKESSTVKKMVYAASSSTYGDSKTLPKVEDSIGKPISPYAVTKLVNEIYADVFFKTYGIATIGLRYFNVFGPKQSPEGAYAAVIPLFMEAAKSNSAPKIHGKGTQTRDFTYVDNAVQANIKAFFATEAATNQIFNIACGENISVNDLWQTIAQMSGTDAMPLVGPMRMGDVQDSLADIGKAGNLLGYKPAYGVKEGLAITWNQFKDQ
ncbi:MAG: SDR family oxidoreductase [Gilvibacter sp.]